MSEYTYTLEATIRQDKGKGASRRLRREGLVPAIVYGGEGEALSVAVKQNDLVKFGRFDSFYSQIICLKIAGQSEDTEVILRDVQRHLYKPLFQHVDFQRVVRGQEMQTTVSLHFINEESCQGVKVDGGIIDHHLTSIEIVCLPRDLPEYIEVDMQNFGIGDSLELKELTLPEGVRLAHDDERADVMVAQVVYPQKSEEETESEEVSDTAAEESSHHDEDHAG